VNSPVVTRPLVAAGVLAAVSLGAAWAPGAAGYTQPSRVLVVVAVALTLLAVRRGTPALLDAAAAAGAVGVLLGGLHPSPGRLALAAAVGCLLVARRPVHRSGGRPTA
jgi:hypothetical protein